jgi:hypothetical protein
VSSNRSPHLHSAGRFICVQRSAACDCISHSMAVAACIICAARDPLASHGVFFMLLTSVCGSLCLHGSFSMSAAAQLTVWAALQRQVFGKFKTAFRRFLAMMRQQQIVTHTERDTSWDAWNRGEKSDAELDQTDSVQLRVSLGV